MSTWLKVCCTAALRGARVARLVVYLVTLVVYMVV